MPLSPLFATTEDLAQEFSQAQSFTYTHEFVNMMISLGVVLTLLIATVWFLKRIMNARHTKLNELHSIQILEKRMLSQKSSLYLIEVHGKTVLIGDSASGIQKVMDVDSTLLEEEPQEIEEMEDSEKKWWKKLLTINA